jgi:phage-related protein
VTEHIGYLGNHLAQWTGMCYHRLICLIIAGQMILLHGFTKKIPQIPKRDLDLAQVRKAEVERSGEETQP